MVLESSGESGVLADGKMGKVELRGRFKKACRTSTPLVRGNGKIGTYWFERAKPLDIDGAAS
jgi:hypothetical protein